MPPPRAVPIEKIVCRHAFSDIRLVLLFASSVAVLTAFMCFYAAMPMLMSRCGLGPGAYGVAPFVAFTYRARLSPHARIGYQWNSNSILAGDPTGTTGSPARCV